MRPAIVGSASQAMVLLRSRIVWRSRCRQQASIVAAVILSVAKDLCRAWLRDPSLRSGRQAWSRRQQAVDSKNVARRQPPGSLAQAQRLEQHVVARACQVATGLVELALRVEHVDVDADADAVAE